VDALVEALRHGDPMVRAESAAAVAELQDPVAVRPLFTATCDADQRVRTQARLALDRLGTAAIIVGVAALLEPMILEAVLAATSRAKGEANGRSPPAGRQPRSRRSNGHRS
jgi:HEAT repeat protein